MTVRLLFLTFILSSISVAADAQVALSESGLHSVSTSMPAETQVIDSMPALFSALSTASQFHSYRSLLTYEANGYLSTFKLSHQVVGDSVHEQLVFLDGPPRQVMRKQQLANCLTGETRWGLWPTVLQESAFSVYSMKPLGVERIADREAITFDISPNDEWRYSYRYSIDRNTGIVLRVVTYLENAVIERLQTVVINYLDLGEDELSEQDKSASAFIWRVPEVEPCHEEQFKPAWKVDWLPEGFVTAGNRLTAQGEQVLIFTDGLVSVSVFIVDNPLEKIQSTTARHGATVAVIAPLASDAKTNIAVVGEVPITTARRIATSVKPQI